MKKLFLLSILFLALVSCKKTIELDLKDSGSRIVIEGNLSNSDQAMVRLSISTGFNENNTFSGVKNAVVTIKNDKGDQYLLAEIQPGVYTNSLKGVPGHSYQLTVSTEGRTYTAVSHMPAPVKLDSIQVQKDILFGKTVYSAIAYYFDPAGLGNYYKFTETVNQKKSPEIWVWDDRILDGRQSSVPLFQAESDIHVGDTVKIEMQCVDKNVYRYFTSLQNVRTSNAAPANPETNINGGALGYFSARTTDTKQIVAR